MVSVICPVLNEERFIRAWCENVTSFSDDIHVWDSGCTDRTIEIIKKYPQIQVHGNGRFHPEISAPYVWREGEVRNRLIEFCKGDWIAILDADELFGERVREALPRLATTKKNFIRLLHLDFWYTPYLIRVRQFKRDWWRRFYPSYQTRFFRNDPDIRYAERGNHAPLQWKGLGKYSIRLSCETWRDVPFHHYHHILNDKPGQNRADEIGLSGIKLMTYFAEHPKETQYYQWWKQ